MQRLLKRYLRPILPNSVVYFLKHRLEKRLAEGATVDVRLETSDASIRCIIDNDWSFLMPLAFEYDFQHHLSPEGSSEFAAIARMSREGGTLFDIGAHAGIVSAMFCAARSGNKAYSFEPSPVSQPRLKAIQELNHFQDRMFIEFMAIGEAAATIEMIFDPDGGYVQTQRFEHSMWKAPKTLNVSIESIPAASARLNVIPDYIKLDIEGYEYEAIKGAQAFLSTHRPMLLLELHLNYLEERQVSAQATVEMLCDCGYSFFSHGGTPLRPQELYDSPLQSVRVIAKG